MSRLTRRHLLRLAGVPAALALAPTACQSTGPLAESGFVPIGGAEQWIEIRGAHRSRPPVLFLHGGPGEAQSPLLSMFAGWEERYVVAQWDQRGSGRTFSKGGTATPNMTLEQIAHDAVEVTQHVLTKLGRSRLILVGHSWGALLGLRVVRLRPDLFHALVATGQPVSGREIIEGMRKSAIVRAQAAGDAQAVATLNGLGPADFSDMSKLGIVFRWAEPFPPVDREYLAKQVALIRPAGDPQNAAAESWYSARQFSLSKLMQAILDFDARADGYEIPVPYFVIQGSGDTRTPTALASAFVDQVRAPAKGFTAIDGGHFACFTNPAGFLDALDAEVRKLRIRPG
jgi:pimeloyl-ACP methyl ester carboxylesterase